MSFFCSRLGLRVVNRHNSNSGAKEFVLSLLNKSDKTLSNHQTQKFMGDPVAELRNIKVLDINGESVKHINIYSTDFEAHSTLQGHGGQSCVKPSFLCLISQSELQNHSKGPHNFKTVKCEHRDLDSSNTNFLKQVNRGRKGSNRFGSIDEFESRVDTLEELDWERQFRTHSKKYNSIIGPDKTGVDGIDLVCPGGVHIIIGLVNNAYKELIGELEKDDLKEVADEVKKVVEKPKRSGGCGATPGKAHGGDLNGGDCLDIVIKNERLFIVIPDSWVRKQDWLDYFSCLKSVLPPLNKCRFWSDPEIVTFEENILTLSKVIQKSFPKRSITIKAHYLLVHTISFIKRFRTYGLFNEQALENLHQVMFRDETKYIHLNKQEELKLGSTMDFQNIGALLEK